MGTAEGHNGGGLLVVEIEDLFDAASGLLCLPLLVLADEGDVGARIQCRPLPSRLSLQLRETARELKGTPLGLIVLGDAVLRAKDPLRRIRLPTMETHQPPLSVSFSDSATKDTPFKHTPRASPRALSYFPQRQKTIF
jgi:hypothetical protein